MPRKYQNPKLEKRTDVKRPYYFIRLTVPDGERKRRRVVQRLAFCDQLSAREAMKLRSSAIDIANAGRMLIQARKKFSDLVRQYQVARLPHLGAGTQKWQASLITNHILPAFGDRALCDMDKPSIEAWLSGKESAGLSWWTRKGLRSVLASIFAAARDWNIWSGDNPTLGIRIGRFRSVREKRLLNADQVRAILAAVSDDTRLMILTALLLGLRISEVCGLKWSDIDFQKGTLEVKRRWYRGDVDEPKTQGSARKHELGPLAADFQLRRVKLSAQAADYVFAGPDGVPNDERDILRYELRPALKRLKLHYPGFGWHAFRRANVTMRQTAGGATPLEAMKAAGHTRVDTTLLYTLTDSDRERSQVQAIFDSILGASKGREV